MPASIKDIAKSLGISVSTVSLALNDKPRVSKEMREKVKQKAKELNYVKKLGIVRSCLDCYFLKFILKNIL